MGFTGISAGKECLQYRRPLFNTWFGNIPWRRNWSPTPLFLWFPGGSDSKESAWNAGYLVLIPGLRRSPGGRHDNPLPYFCLENPHGQRILASYSPWGHKELDMTEQLNWIEWAFFTLIIIVKIILVHTFYKVNNSIRF